MQDQLSPGAPPNVAFGASSLGLEWPSPSTPPPAMPVQTDQVPAANGTSSLNRVCDNCIRKKVKCDLVRPACSYCSLRGYDCNYSSARRRPGPARGSRRGSRRAQRTLVREHCAADPQPVGTAESSTADSRWSSRSVASSSSPHTTGPGGVEIASAPPSVASHARSASAPSGASQDGRRGWGNLTRLGILPEEAEQLLQQFLDTVHSGVPIFSPARFLSSVRSFSCSGDLVLTLVLITAKLTGFTFASRDFDLDSRVDSTLSSGSLEQDVCDDFQSIDQFRKACLLAFYEFHQFPGQQAWMRVGSLARLAYWRGLDRLDGPRNLQTQALGWGNASQDDLEDWRLVWWFIYRLDAYVNLSSGTPYLIDERSARTGLLNAQPRDGQTEQGQQGPLKPELCLPSRPNDLWRLVPAIASGPPATILPNLHIVSSTATRQVGRALQECMMMMPSTDTPASLADAEGSLSALRLSLPRDYLNPTRNAFLEESRSDHHARLVTVLHLLMCRLLLSIISCAPLGQANDEWLLNWQKVLETCQDIASIAEQWNSTFSLSVDPGVCFIIFTALIFVDLHKKFARVGTDSALYPNLEHCEVILVLLLEQFASAWTLPRLLILSFKSFQASTTGPLDRRHIQSILFRFEAPLHPRWLEFLSSAQPDLEIHPLVM